MSELPVGWAQAPVADLVDFHGGGTPSKADPTMWDAGVIPWVSPKDMKALRIVDSEDHVTDKALAKLTLAPPGAVLMVVRSGILCRTLPLAIGMRPVTVNQDMRVMLARVGIMPEYLLYQLISNEAKILDGCAKGGTTVASIEAPAFARYPLSVAPTAEQSRIVAKLEELLSDLDAGVAELKAAQAKLGQYRQSLLKAAVDGSLTAEWRRTHTPSETGAQLLERILLERRQRWEAKQLAKFQEQGKTPPKGWQNHYPHPVRPDTTGLPALPDGWVWATVEQLTDFVTSGSRGWAEYYSEQGAVFIRSQNINTDKLCLDDVAFVNPPRGSEGARTKVQKNDLLLTITGANVGKVALVDVELEEAYVSQHVALLRPTMTLYCKYLHLYLTAKVGGRSQLDKAAYGAGKPGLNLTQVVGVSVPLPPVTEMTELMSQLALGLDSIDVQSDAVFTTQVTAAAQRKNILKAAFSGQLVPQDPNDEPASVLLDRIRAERAVQGAKGAKRGRKANA